MEEMFIRILVIWNVIVFAIYGIDKYKAIKGRWRISEKFLLLCAFLLGAPGAAFGMGAFRHKTKKLLFKLCIPAALFANLGILILLERI